MQYTRNILKVYKQAMPEEVEHGMCWYADALMGCKDIAKAHNLPVHIVVGVVSALSPNNKWDRNLKDARQLIDIYQQGGDVEEVVVCTYGAMRQKAWRVIDEGHDIDSVLKILNGQKIKAFFECILGLDTCVIDGHAKNIANGKRYSLSDGTSVGVREFRELQAAYVRAAKRRNMTAYQMQAITWVTWRRIHNVR